MSDPQPTLFSPMQRRIIAAGATALAGVVLLAAAFGLLLLLRGFVAVFQDVLLPLAIAAILATLLRPVITLCESRLRLSRVQGIVLLYLLVILVLGLAGVLAVPLLLRQCGEFVRYVPELREDILAFLRQSAPPVWEWLQESLGEPPELYFRSLLGENSGMLKQALAGLHATLGSVGGFLRGLFATVAAYSIIPVYLFFLLNGDHDPWRDVDRQLGFLSKERREDLLFLGRQFSGILTSFFRGQILIGLMLGAVLAGGFALVGLRFGILFGLVLGLLNIVPYLGTILGVATVLPLAYFQESGGLRLILFCTGVFVLGQLLVDYVFTPRVMGSRTGMSPMLIVFSIFFWGTALGGVLGMVLAIPLTAFFLVFWRLVREKYLPALTARGTDAS